MIGVISFALVSVAADLIFTFNSYYNFTLTKEGNKLNTSRGFLSKIKGAIPLKKLQMLVLTTNIIKEKFDYWGLKIETAGGSQMRVPEVAVPFAKLDKLLPIVEELFQIGLPNSFKMVSKKSLQRNILRTVMIVGILTGVTAYWLKLQALWLLLLIPVISFYIYKRWVNRAYTIENNKIYVKEGWIYKKIKIIPIDKLQTLKIRETLFQRLWDLATLEIDTAATLSIVDAGIIDIEKHEAETIFSEISETFDKFNTVQTPN
jgi:putative membrane protein